MLSLGQELMYFKGKLKGLLIFKITSNNEIILHVYQLFSKGEW